MCKKVAIIGSVGLPAKYGGFETLVENITKYLNKDYKFTIYCSSKTYNKKLLTYNNSNLKYLRLKANGPQSILYDLFAMIDALKYADTLLILGVSGCSFLPIIKLISNQKIIVNIDGMEWKRQKWGWFSKLFLKFSESIAIKYADEIISDNKIIFDYINLNYSRKANLITYGGDHCKKIKISEKLSKKYSFIKGPYVFSVCRVEPENNLEIILKAFSSIKSKNLVVIGNWVDSSYGLSLKLKYSTNKNIYLLDSIYDQNILNQLRSNCEIYVHGHSAGGTNPSLVEAMFMGLAILCYDVNYNTETTKNSALYFKTHEDIIKIIREIKQNELIKVSNKMKKIAKEKYTWNQISKEYKLLL
tara:strand:- start:520 stop:1596 length:1077 start_codon:yes stop_codon:yes gene_type:complete